jgi:hypothetical protein
VDKSGVGAELLFVFPAGERFAARLAPVFPHFRGTEVSAELATPPTRNPGDRSAPEPSSSCGAWSPGIFLGSNSNSCLRCRAEP